MFGRISGWRFVLVSDDSIVLTLSESKAVPVGVPTVIGRGSKAFQHSGFDHKYCSRRQLSVHLVSTSAECEVLRLSHLGRNPTFVGSGAAKLDVIELTPQTATLEEGTEGLSLTTRPTLPGSVFFPKGLGIPTIHFFFVPRRSVSKLESAEETHPAAPLCVPSGGASDPTAKVESPVNLLRALASVSDDDDETPPPRLLRKGPSVLDQAMREYAQSQQQALCLERTMAEYSEPAAADNSQQPPPLPPRPQHRPTTPARPLATTPQPQLRGVVERPQHPQGAMDSPKAASVRLLSPPAAAPPPAAAAVWEWNARPDGDDGDPRSWKRYPPADAALLERQYRKDGGSVSKCQLNAEYDVCFSDKRHGMVQIRRDDASRWRRVRRLGGELVPRPRAKPIRCVADVDGSSSGSSRFGSDDDYDREDSFINDDDDDDESSDDSESSFSFDSESSSSSEGSKRKRKRRKMEKTRQKPTQRK